MEKDFYRVRVWCPTASYIHHVTAYSKEDAVARAKARVIPDQKLWKFTASKERP